MQLRAITADTATLGRAFLHDAALETGDPLILPHTRADTEQPAPPKRGGFGVWGSTPLDGWTLVGDARPARMSAGGVGY